MALIHFLTSDFAYALGRTIIDSLWQGLLIVLLLRFVLLLLSHVSSEVRYNLSYFAYTGITLWFPITFYRHWPAAGSKTVFSDPSLFSQVTANQTQQTDSFAGFSFGLSENFFSYVAAFYTLGIIISITALLVHYFETCRLRKMHRIRPDSYWQHRINKLMYQLNIKGKAAVFFSDFVETPIMFGWIKPLILLPVAVVNRLTIAETEAIIIHELAHIRRNDYLMNWIQSVMDTILFFNPVSWWLSKYLNRMRERCCDELVMKFSDPYPYANALLTLEKTRRASLFTLAATGKHPQLLYRIKNIMEMKKNHFFAHQKGLAALFVVFTIFSVAWLSPIREKPATGEIARNIANNDISGLQAEHPDKMTATDKKREQPSLSMASHTGNHSSEDTARLPLHRDTLPSPPLPPTPAVPSMPPSPPLPPALSFSPRFDTVPWPPISAFDDKDFFKTLRDTARLKQYFNNPEWEKQMEAVIKNSADIQKKNEELWKQGADAMKKYFDGQEWQKQWVEIAKSKADIEKNKKKWEREAKSMKKYFESPEWKRQLENINKNITELQKRNGEFQKQIQEFKNYFKSSEWLQLQKNMEQMRLDMEKKYKDSSNVHP